jgi:hypothetical protein
MCRSFMSSMHSASWCIIQFITAASAPVFRIGHHVFTMLPLPANLQAMPKA